MVDTAEATRRLNVKKQTLDDAYAAPANFLEIDILNPITHGVAKKRYTDYEVRMRVSTIHFRVYNTHHPIDLHYFQTNLPVFKVKESSVRRRYSDFEWLRIELERDSKVNDGTTFPIHVYSSKKTYCPSVLLLYKKVDEFSNCT